MKGTALLVVVTLQRTVELMIARRNTQALRGRGAYEVGAGHYPAVVALHASWLATLWLRGRQARVSPLWLSVFLVLQLGRGWVLATLGERWTTRIMILPGTAPVITGPYRFVRHPNYLIVAIELPCVALAVGRKRAALLFGVVNVAVLGWRIRWENRAFAKQNGTSNDGDGKERGEVGYSPASGSVR